MTHITTDEGAPLTGAKVLAMLIAFFGVMFAVNGFMTFEAISTFRGEVTDHAYEKGLAYNKQIAAAEAQTERHWKVDLTLASGAVSAAFRGVDGALLTGLDVTARFTAPADSKRDQRVTFVETGPGFYVASPLPAHGAWDLEMTAKREGETLFQSKNRVAIR